MDSWSPDLNSDFTLKGCLLGGIKLAKNADPDKYVYSGYGIGFDLRSEFSLLDGKVGENATIFGVDMSSSVHTDNKEKDKLILSIGPRQGFGDVTSTAETQYSINFSRSTVFLSINATKKIWIWSKRFWNIKISLVFKKYFRRLFIQ